MQIPVYSAVQPVPDSTFRVSTPSQPTRYTQSPRPPSQTPVPTQQAQPQPQPQPPHVSVTPQTAKPPPVAVPNYLPQQVGQQFIPQQQAARNGVQKQGSAAALATMAAHMLQGQGLSYQQQMQMYAQHRNLQQQQRQKMNGRATPQAGVASPAQQPHAALSPANQASSPLVANQQVAAAATRSPMPPSAPQPTQAQASVAQQQQQQQPQLQPSSMPRSPAQQPAQAHGQHPGYGQFNLRGMMHTNPSAAQALQAAITNVANTGAVRAGIPPNSAVPDHLQQPQQPTHPQVQPPGQPTQPQPNQQPQAQAQSTPHPQQAQQGLPRQMYPQMYSYHQLPFNMQNASRIPQYWSGMGMGMSVQGMPGVPNMAGIAGMQSVPGMQGMGGLPPGMMPGMGRGIPMGAQQMAGMAAAAGAGAGHVPGGQGKAAVQGSMQR